MSQEKNQTNSSLVARIDERTQAIQQSLTELRSDIRSQNATLSEKIQTSEKRLLQRIEGIEDNYVKGERYAPVERLVYGIVGLIMLTVVGTLVVSIINPSPISQAAIETDVQ